jgi:hypothetical protein
MWHEWAHKALVAAGVPFMQEVRLDRWLPAGWSGTADWIMFDPERAAFVLGDMNTIKGDGTPWIEKDGAKLDHIEQLSAASVGAGRQAPHLSGSKPKSDALTAPMSVGPHTVTQVLGSDTEQSTMRNLSPAAQQGFHAGRRPANVGKRYPAEILTSVEVLGLIRACSSRAPTGLRNRALIALLYRGGLRVGEALALHPKDIDSVRGTVSVLHGKGDRRRTVGLDPGAMAIVERWVEVRKTLVPKGRVPLLCTLEGHRLQSSYVRALLPRLAAKAGIEKRVHAHALRHTHAAELASEGFPLNLVQQQLGHANLATTDRYLRHVAPVELIQAMRSRGRLDP